eukprot:CAMPEP_0113885278 /NCGR_PEP_ID=MMETSP0780_2-20120614/10811_1 /TAXON_ID=652834 /ORGANISM="Palpitomonas bilix" /LENGTH=544 /DNA_ID=CAMNT_0000873165 /DNA_START=341 /DNA_END=1971 /DNA_ORIENTATION=- /assembly_acc=CAM_ASM_000599
MTLKYRANELLAKIDSTLRDALSSFAKDATSLGANKGGGTESDGAPPPTAYTQQTIDLGKSLDMMRTEPMTKSAVDASKTSGSTMTMKEKAEGLKRKGTTVKLHPAFVSMLRSNAGTQTDDAEFMQFKMMSQELEELRRDNVAYTRELHASRHSLHYKFRDEMEKYLAELKGKVQSDIDYLVHLHEKEVKKKEGAMNTELRHEVSRRSSALREEYEKKEKQQREKHAKEKARLQAEIEDRQKEVQERDDTIRHFEQDIFHLRAQLSCAQLDIDSYANEAKGIKARQDEMERMKTQLSLTKSLLDREQSRANQLERELGDVRRDCSALRTRAEDAEKRAMEVEKTRDKERRKEERERRQQEGEMRRELERKEVEVERLKMDAIRSFDLTSMVSSRQGAALDEVMRERDRLREEVEELRRERASKGGRWETGANGNKVWVDDKNETDGLHGGVDVLGMTKAWKWYKEGDTRSSWNSSSAMSKNGMTQPPATAVTPRPPASAMVSSGRREVAHRRASIKSMADRLNVTPRPDKVEVEQSKPVREKSG